MKVYGRLQGDVRKAASQLQRQEWLGVQVPDGGGVAGVEWRSKGET